MSIDLIFVLLIVFQFKHWLCDHIFQTNYMLKKANKVGWLFPLLSHSVVHAYFTFLIVLSINPDLLWLSLVDLTTHFLVDKLKADKRMLGRFTITTKMFWVSLGLDQMLHHLTYYFIIYTLVINYQ